MSHVWYNGVRLVYVRTNSAEAEVVRNGPDYLYTRHVLTFQTIIAGGLGSQFLLPGSSRAEVIRRVRHALETPRRPFKFEFGGATVLEADATSDANHGPMPEVIGFDNFVGGESVHVQFRITVCKRECDERGEQTPEYLSHRWSESAGIADDFRTTYRRTGSLIVASNARRNGRPVQTVDEYRYLVVPRIPEGFTLKGFDFAVSEDNLSLSYTVEYAEADVGGMPPPPAVRAEGNTIVHTTNGARATAVANVKLTGHPRSDKKVLLATAIAIAMTELERRGARKGNSEDQWKVWGSVGTQLYRNEVEVQLNALVTNQDRFITELRGDRAAFGDFPSGSGAGGSNNPTIGNELPPGPGGSGRGPGGDVPPGTSKPGPDAFDSPSVAKPKPPPPFGYPAGDAKPGDPAPDRGLLAPKALVPFNLGEPPLYSEPWRAQTPDPGLRATAGLRLIGALINDPCAREQVVDLRGVPRGLAELVASAPGGDLTRHLPGLAARSSARVVGAVVPDLTEAIRQQRRRQAKPPGSGYVDYRLHLQYSIDPNMSAMAEQREGGLTHFVQWSAEEVTLTVRWATERVGDVPAIPERSLGDDNAVFLGGDFSPGDVDLAADGQTLVFRSAGWWKFGFKDPKKVKYGAGIAPWLAALLGGPPKPVIIGPELLHPDGPLGRAAQEAGRTGEAVLRGGANVLGDYNTFWRSIWRGFVTALRGLTR